MSANLSELSYNFQLWNRLPNMQNYRVKQPVKMKKASKIELKCFIVSFINISGWIFCQISKTRIGFAH